MIFPGIFFLMYPLFIIIEKQTLLIVLFFIILASSGFRSAPDALSEIFTYYGIGENRWGILLRKSIRHIMVFLLIVSSISYLRYSGFDRVPPSEEHKKAGIYLKQQVGAGYEQLNVMARKPFVNFYSEARFTMIPYAGLTDLLDFASLYDVDFIVVDEASLGTWEHFDDLFHMHMKSDQADLFYEDTSDRPIRLFRIVR